MLILYKVYYSKAYSYFFTLPHICTFPF